jgi:hypothetical protein
MPIYIGVAMRSGGRHGGLGMVACAYCGPRGGGLRRYRFAVLSPIRLCHRYASPRSPAVRTFHCQTRTCSLPPAHPGDPKGRSPRSTLRRVRFRRYRRGALILTTNRALADFYPLFPNPVLAEGLLDRLLNSAYVVTMRGRSYRPRQRPGAGWSINLINTRPTWIADAITP